MTKKKKNAKRGFAIFLATLLTATSLPFTAGSAFAQDEPFEIRFDFGTSDSSVADGYVKVTEESIYSAEQGFGFTDTTNVLATNRESTDELQSDFVSFSDTIFSVDLPNGDYAVSIVSGDADETTEFGVKAESIQKIQDTSLNAGQFTDKNFEIALIDGQLTIELTGKQPKINALTITELPRRISAAHPTVYVASDSTAQTYDPYWNPQAGWGQMLPRYFDTDVTIKNHAIGGRSSKTFYTEGRLDTILREIKPNDYLLIQFGHNDATISVPERYTSVEDFKIYMETYVAGIRQRGGIPILVTPVGRRSFNPETEKFNISFPGYKQAMEDVAAEQDVLLVDLNTLSREYYDEIGPEGTRSVFLHVDAGVYSAFPEGRTDDTHFQAYGATQIARLLSGGIAKLDTPLANYVVEIAPPESAPSPPTALVFSSISNAGALLTWDDVEGADIYRIYRKPSNEDEFKLIGTSTISRHSLTGMDEVTTYDVVVTAVNLKGESKQSEIVQVTTQEATLKFDFGLDGTPVAGGYTAVNLSTIYSKERGYGIVDSEGMIGRDRGEGGDVLRDWLGYFNVGWHFNVDVPNGLYAVKMYVGDFLGSARTNLAIEGEDYGAVNAPSRGYIERVITNVKITDGQMNFHFTGSTGIVNGIELTPILVAPSDIALTDQSIDANNPSVTLSWNETVGANSYNIYRQTSGTEQAELIKNVNETTFTDPTVDLGKVYDYTITTVDNSGAESVASLPLTVEMIGESHPDTTSPTTTHLIDQEAINGWYNSNVTIELDAVDADSGVADTYYSVNNGEQQVGRQIVLEEEGIYNVSYWSIDLSGNTEEKNHVEVSIDKTAPTIDFSVEADTIFTVDQEISISCEVEDALSGIDSVTCEESTKLAYELGVGTYTLTAEATDKAGNSIKKDIEIFIEVNYDSLSSLSQKFIDLNNGNADITEGLQSKLAAAKISNEKGNTKARDNQLNAFVNQVNSQTGKALANEQAETLINLAKALME
ncbi:OmpL47-type beta-barrel domain-containing protein [Halalkalibacter alkalisediminis]|uniref:OmpL47-type beta-barrel domain-containing protein n=1 Tax=Halalkalibacter alkalisediminis TaxID=935616 RepID=A0ABV6NF96_9BACI|nr:GDSL-type esterase/lipase family protein [Halalkalibacter alkalisediminis]